MALYVPQTLEHLPVDEATHSAQLRTIDARLGVNLVPAQLALPRVQLKRAQIREYDGVPITQITYLDPAHGAMALCVTLSHNGSRDPAHERRYGMNVVYWADMEHAWMLIGHNPAAELEEMAKRLKADSMPEGRRRWRNGPGVDQLRWRSLVNFCRSWALGKAPAPSISTV